MAMSEEARKERKRETARRSLGNIQRLWQKFAYCRNGNAQGRNRRRRNILLQ